MCLLQAGLAFTTDVFAFGTFSAAVTTIYGVIKTWFVWKITTVRAGAVCSAVSVLSLYMANPLH